MKTEEFVFNLVNRIPTKEKFENFLGLGDREEIDKIGQLAYYLRTSGYKYKKIYLGDRVPIKDRASKEIMKYINSLGIKEADFPEGVPTTIKAYMDEKGIAEPDFRPDIIEKLESTKCVFTDSVSKDNYQKRVEYFIELKMELDNHVLPALRAIKDESIYEDATPIADLEDWLKSNLSVLEFDLDDPNISLKASPLSKEYLKKGLSFEETVALEIVEFSMDKGLAKIGVCENCGRNFLWNRRDSKYCYDSCKSRKSESRKESKGGK